MKIQKKTVKNYNFVLYQFDYLCWQSEEKTIFLQYYLTLYARWGWNLSRAGNTRMQYNLFFWVQANQFKAPLGIAMCN